MPDRKDSNMQNTTIKDGNPKDTLGCNKVSLSNVPLPPLMEIALAMQEGALKYGRHNYREAGVRESIYFDAAMRHLFKYWEGEDIDPDSGLPHVVKAMASLIVLRDGQIQGNSTDDRPLSSPLGWYKTLDDRAKLLRDRQRRLVTKTGRKRSPPLYPYDEDAVDSLGP